MVGLEGIEPPTNGLGNRCSILLSYRPVRTYVNRKLAGAGCSAGLPLQNQALKGWNKVRIPFIYFSEMVVHQLTELPSGWCRFAPPTPGR